MTPKILVAGIGNISKGDDGFGVEVIRQLMALPRPEGVELLDVGIRGLDFGYRLLDSDHSLIIMVDLLSRGGTAGTLYHLEPDLELLDRRNQSAHSDAHDIILGGCSTGCGTWVAHA